MNDEVQKVKQELKYKLMAELGLYDKVEISLKEYKEILKKTPYMAHKDIDSYYKYIFYNIADEEFEELYNIKQKIANIEANNSIKFIKDKVAIWHIIGTIAIIFAVIMSFINIMSLSAR